jgi:hypothetical protein
MSYKTPTAEMIEMARRLAGPILPPCSTWSGRTRCPKRSYGWLFDPDGKPNPGGYVCREHGEAVVAELQEKIGERWTLVPFNEERR